jgi:Amt family ammonium transporter
MGGVAFGAQLIGTVLGILVAVIGGLIIYQFLRRLVGLRLDAEQEFEGADLSIHKIGATPDREPSW